MSILKYKHFFTVKNGKFEWESKEMLDFVRRNMEGKRGYAIFEEVNNDDKSDVYAYYFGGIIRRECMESNSFAGLTEKEIHEILMMETGNSNTITFEHPRDGRIIYDIPMDIKKWPKRRMGQYVEQVIALLNTEYQIYPKPSSHYKGNNYYMDKKTFK